MRSIPERTHLRLRLQPVGHIQGSAYLNLEAACPKTLVRVNAEYAAEAAHEKTVRVVFSGDLGAPQTALRPDVQSPERADRLVIESTYRDRVHESRYTRSARLQVICEYAFGNGATLLIPALSIGRAQELGDFKLEVRRQGSSPQSFPRRPGAGSGS